MKEARKIITFTSLAGLTGCIGLLIAAIFGAKVFEGTLLKVLLTLAIVTAATAISLNAINYMNKKKILSFISLALTGALMALAIIIVWGAISWSNVLTKITVLLALATIFFNVIVAYRLKLEKRYIAIQIAAYTLLGVLDIIITLLVFEVNLFQYNWFWQPFTVLVIVVVGFLAALAILGRRANDIGSVDNEKMLITREEYNSMLKKIADLEAELAEKNKE